MRKALTSLKILVFLSSLYSITAHSLELLINGTTVITKNETIRNGQIFSAETAEVFDLNLGKNKIQNLPLETKLSFRSNNGPDDALITAGAIIKSPIPDQNWIFVSGREITLNCGRYNSSPAFISFGNENQLLSGCSTVDNQILKTPTGDYVRTAKGSKVDFFEDGNLKSSTKTKGRISVLENQTIRLEDETSLSYHNNGALHYFYPKQRESFEAPTEISLNTYFEQPVTDQVYPVIFHNNGNISAAILAGYNNHNITINAYGDTLDFKIQSGPVGFDEHGRIDRLYSTSRIQIHVQKETLFQDTSLLNGNTSINTFKAGETVYISPYTQLFLLNYGRQKFLFRYPIIKTGNSEYMREIIKPSL